MNFRKGFSSPFLRGFLPVLALVLTVGIGIWSALLVSAATTFSWPTVQQGSIGENVFSVQLMLQARGHSLSIDGNFGPQTVAAVKSFQSAHKLSVDGAVGPKTWPVLIVTTSNGSRGSAVKALQRQLNAHGANLTVDGAFGSLTAAAVKSYQSKHHLTVNGTADLQTWSSLVAAAPPPPPGKVLWGVDSVSFITPSFLGQIKSTFGTPQFVGRYIDARAFTPMSASEASFIHSQGIRILPILSDFGGDTGSSTGIAKAHDALAKASALGIPKGRILITDIENGSAVNAAYIEGWYNTITAAGYVAGYYENPFPGSSGFNSAFCSAISADPGVAKSTLYSTERSIGRTTRARMPSFAPAGLLCNGQSRGGFTRIWQYGLQGNGSVNIDTDEVQSSVPLW